MQLVNSSAESLTNFTIKLNSNFLGLMIAEDFP